MRASVLDGRELRQDRKGPLFRTIARGNERLSNTTLPKANAFQVPSRRAGVVDIKTAISNYSFRITSYLINGDTGARTSTNYRGHPERGNHDHDGRDRLRHIELVHGTRWAVTQGYTLRAGNRAGGLVGATCAR